MFDLLVEWLTTRCRRARHGLGGLRLRRRVGGRVGRCGARVRRSGNVLAPPYSQDPVAVRPDLRLRHQPRHFRAHGAGRRGARGGRGCGSRLPWSFLDEAQDPALIRERTWIVVGEGSVRAVAQVIEIDGEIVRVRPLPGPVYKRRHLLSDVA